MGRPKQGTAYNVQLGDNIVSISLLAYGYDRRDLIIDANQSILKDRLIISGIPTIFEGDLLTIPVDNTIITETVETIPAESIDEIAIRIDGTILKGWTSYTAKRSMNTVADGFSFTAPYVPSDKNSQLLDPHKFYNADLFVGGKLYISGITEKHSPDSASNSIKIECRSKSASVVDCPSIDQKLNYFQQTIKSIAELILKPFNLAATFPDGDPAVDIEFPEVQRNLTDTVFSFLQGLSKKIGLQMNSTRPGGLKFEKANLSGDPVLNLVEGSQPQINVAASFDSSKRFSDFIAIGQGRGQEDITASVKDSSVSIFRPTFVDAKDSTSTNVQTAAEWARSKSLAASASISVRIAGHLDKRGQPIVENETITLKAPQSCIFNETKFLIESVELGGSESSKYSVLTLVLPESYTTDFPEAFPWSR